MPVRKPCALVKPVIQKDFISCRGGHSTQAWRRAAAQEAELGARATQAEAASRAAEAEALALRRDLAAVAAELAH
jgi:hypothetical protein